jgi:hypothetical protein
LSTSAARKAIRWSSSARNRWRIVLIAFVVLLRIVSEPTIYISFAVLSAYALFGRTQAIQALGLTWLFSMLNSGVVPEVEFTTIGRYLVIAASSISVLLRSGFPMDMSRIGLPVFSTLALGAFIVLHSILFSPVMDVSLLKAILWMIVMVTLISAWNRISETERGSCIVQLFNGLAVVMALSLLLAMHPVGYLLNSTGLQGIMNHPQAFGSTMALLGSWAAARVISARRPAWSVVGLLMLCIVSVILSESRTAGMSLMLGISVAVLILPACTHKSIRILFPALLSGRMYFVVGATLIAVFAAGPMLADRASSFVAKSGRADVGNIAEAYEVSRGPLMKKMLNNVSNKPLQGIGFGIASAPSSMDVKRDALLGLPVGAAVEKGVLPLSILEELGIFGFAAVVAWLWMILRRSARGGIVPLAIVTTGLVLNLGESTLFSTGGMGLLSTILFAWALNSDAKRHIREKKMHG